MAKKATPEELEAARKLDAALELEENAANQTDLQTLPEGAAGAGASPDVAGNESNTAAPETIAPKRRRGRPTDAERALRENIAPGTGSGSDTGSGGAKRGPKPRAKGSDVGTLAKSLVGIHQLVAMVTGIPEAQLNEAEGTALAEGVCAVCEEYGLAINGKTGAAMQLFGACAMIYGPRLFHFKMRMAQQRAQAENMVNGTITAPGN